MKYTANVDTLLKKKPVQGSILSANEKVVVAAGRSFFIEDLLETDGLHSQVELDFDAGSWWIFLPHWDTGDDGEVKAVFSMRLADSNSTIYGSLAFFRDGIEFLRVRATSGRAPFQGPNDWTKRAKGPIPPDRDWKINTTGYYISEARQPGIAGMFYHITPDPDPDTGRSEFGLHRDANEDIAPGSAGCIVVKTSDLDNKVRPIIDGLRGKQTHISLEVKYT